MLMLTLEKHRCAAKEQYSRRKLAIRVVMAKHRDAVQSLVPDFHIT